MDDKMKAIRDRVKALLAMADDPNVDGEVHAAMAAAQRLLEAYRLDEAEIRAEAQAAAAAGDEPEIRMDRGSTLTHGANLSAWESVLSSAVGELVGTVCHYRTRAAEYTTAGAFGRVEKRTALVWYGPAEDVELARELFADLQMTIATIAQGRYGGVFRGDGAAYAMGFARALWARAQEESAKRRTVVTPAITAIVRVGGRDAASLAVYQRQIRDDAGKWLEREAKIKLRAGSRRSFGYSSGSSGAHAAGYSDGQRAGFAAERRRKLN